MTAGSLGSQLIENGWRQGSLFAAPSACLQWNALSEADAGDLTTPKARKSRCHRFVLATQTCDLLSPKELRVEALECNHERDSGSRANADRNSVRAFLIDPATGLVADATQRLFLAKEILMKLNPEPWPGDPTRYDRFQRWLGRRYDRPALPDVLVDAFVHPVEAALRQLVRKDPDTALAFSDAVHDVRVNMPSTDYPPFDLHLVLIIRRRISTDQADAIDAAVQAIRLAVDPVFIHLDPDVRMATDEEISVAEYFATRPLFLEYLTYHGEEVGGARPFGQA